MKLRPINFAAEKYLLIQILGSFSIHNKLIIFIVLSSEINCVKIYLPLYGYYCTVLFCTSVFKSLDISYQLHQLHNGIFRPIGGGGGQGPKKFI